MHARSPIAILAFLVSLLMLSACASYAPARSFDDRLAYAYGVHTAVMAAAARSLDAGTLSSADGQRIADLADESRAILDSALEISRAGRAAEADRQLVLATAILGELQRYLRGP